MANTVDQAQTNAPQQEPPKPGLLEKLDNTAFAQKHSGIWKFVKFLIVGGLSSIVELAVFYTLRYAVFKNIADAPVNAPAGLMKLLEFIKLTEGRGYLFAFLISITVGYSMAFVMNRKGTFHSDVNVALSTVLYALMVLFTILAGAWIGTTLSTFLVNNHLQSIDFLAKPVQMAIPTLWTWPLSRYVIYRQKK